MKIITFFLLALSLNAVAQSPLCGRSRGHLKDLLLQEDSRIAFKNGGGLFNGGVCWWHSRLQRSSAYLTIYQPNAKKPTTAQVDLILRRLRQMDSVVVIPGFSDFNSFSKEHQSRIQRMLEAWQRSDGIINAEWRRGISGRSSLPAAEMEAAMKRVFYFYSNSATPIWIMAQMKGITSHAFLVLHMVENGSGYDLDVIDSNRPLATRRIEYTRGDTQLRTSPQGTPFVPYVGFQNDFVKISQSLKSHCHGITEEFSHEILPGDIEL
jgi:hypothetical protein